MYMQAYQDISGDDQEEARDHVRRSFAHSVSLMRQSDDAPQNPGLRVEASMFTMRLWTYLLEDLASSENALPRELKATLISIGIFILKRLEEMRFSNTLSFGAIIEISETLEQA